MNCNQTVAITACNLPTVREKLHLKRRESRVGLSLNTAPGETRTALRGEGSCAPAERTVPREVQGRSGSDGAEPPQVSAPGFPRQARGSPVKPGDAALSVPTTEQAASAGQAWDLSEVPTQLSRHRRTLCKEGKGRLWSQGCSENPLC